MTKYLTKTICLIFCILPLSISFAQVGINTVSPAGIFHIDGQKDNPMGVLPTDPRTKNDFVIDHDGNVGIGTIAPIAKVDIVGNTPYSAFMMVDGTQQSGRLLMADSSGKAFWGMTKGAGGSMSFLQAPVTYGGTNNTPIAFFDTDGITPLHAVNIQLPGTYAFMLRWTAIYHNSTLATAVPILSTDPRNFTSTKIQFRIFINNPGTYLDSDAYDIQIQDVNVTNGMPFSVYVPFTTTNIPAGASPVITVKASATESFELVANDGITATSAIMFYKL